MSLEEIWKPIVGYEGIYWVSNLGNFKNKNRLRRPVKRKDGYFHLKLRKDGIEKMMLTHRIIAEAFLFRPSDAVEVNHLDGNRSNHCLINLEWCTRNQNQKHAYKYLGKSAKGMKNSRAVLKPNDVKIIRSFRINPKTKMILSKVFGIRPESINNIMNFRSWKDI